MFYMTMLQYRRATFQLVSNNHGRELQVSLTSVSPCGNRVHDAISRTSNQAPRSPKSCSRTIRGSRPTCRYSNCTSIQRRSASSYETTCSGGSSLPPKGARPACLLHRRRSRRPISFYRIPSTCDLSLRLV